VNPRGVRHLAGRYKSTSGPLKPTNELGRWTEHVTRHPISTDPRSPAVPTFCANLFGYWRNRQRRRPWKWNSANTTRRKIARRTADAAHGSSIRSDLFVGSRGSGTHQCGAADGQALDLRRGSAGNSPALSQGTRSTSHPAIRPRDNDGTGHSNLTGSWSRIVMVLHASWEDVTS
jgi:hypothetical protein